MNLYRGEYKKAYDAFTKYRESPGLTIADKSDAYRAIAWGQVTQGKTADALKTLDAWDAEIAKANDADAGIWATLVRADVLIESNKAADGLKIIAALLERIEKSTSPASRKLHQKTSTHAIEVSAYSHLKKTADAEKARDANEALVKDSDDADLKDDLAFSRGEAALAKGDAAAAATLFKGCSPTFDYCALERLKAEDKAGLTSEATTTRAQLAKSRRRWAESFYTYWSSSKLSPPPVAKK